MAAAQAADAARSPQKEETNAAVLKALESLAAQLENCATRLEKLETGSSGGAAVQPAAPKPSAAPAVSRMPAAPAAPKPAPKVEPPLKGPAGIMVYIQYWGTLGGAVRPGRGCQCSSGQ